MTIKVFTYNVLHPRLGENSEFYGPVFDANVYNGKQRWPKVLDIILAHLQQGHIMLLQEMSGEWRDLLIAALPEGCRSFYVEYINPWNTIDMNVITIIPPRYRVLSHNTFDLSELKDQAAILGPAPVHSNFSILRSVFNFVRHGTFHPDSPSTTRHNAIISAAKRDNVGILVSVSDTLDIHAAHPDVVRPIHIANWHAPCIFEKRDTLVAPAMVYIVDAAMKAIANLIPVKTDPVIWGGDFNCSQWNLLRILNAIYDRTGSIEYAILNRRVVTPAQLHTIKVVGSDFSNCSSTKWNEFCGGIDHFILMNCSGTGLAAPLPLTGTLPGLAIDIVDDSDTTPPTDGQRKIHRSRIVNPGTARHVIFPFCPNAVTPSDHIPFGVDITLK